MPSRHCRTVVRKKANQRADQHGQRCGHYRQPNRSVKHRSEWGSIVRANDYFAERKRKKKVALELTIRRWQGRQGIAKAMQLSGQKKQLHQQIEMKQHDEQWQYDVS